MGRAPSSLSVVPGCKDVHFDLGMAPLPQVGDDEQNKWCALLRDSVADIRGAPHQPYLTFRDGWRALVAIDASRAGHGWTTLPG